MRYVPTLNDDGLKTSLTVSVVLHSCMFAFLFIGLPRMVPPLPAHHGPIPFDIVEIGEITNTRLGGGSDTAGNPPPPSSAPAPPQQPAAEPAPPQPQEKLTPPKAAETAPKMEDVIEGLKLKPQSKPKPPESKPQQPQDLLGSVLKNVAKMKPAPVSSGKDPNAAPSSATSGLNASPQGVASSNPGNSMNGVGTGTGPALATRLMITEEDALRRQIEQCWNPPVGARDAKSLVVEVVIDVNADRTVSNADVVDKLRYATDPFFRAAADAAIRAVRSPKCSPLQLAPEKYEQWKRINFTFDPRDML